MEVKLHANATVTPKQRRYIYENRHLPTAQLQRELGVGYKTIKRWKSRPEGLDKSSRPNKIKCSMNAAQEFVIVEMRVDLQLSLDVLTREVGLI